MKISVLLNYKWEQLALLPSCPGFVIRAAGNELQRLFVGPQLALQARQEGHVVTLLVVPVLIRYLGIR